jgi:hypothetical protein
LEWLHGQLVQLESAAQNQGRGGIENQMMELGNEAASREQECEGPLLNRENKLLDKWRDDPVAHLTFIDAYLSGLEACEPDSLQQRILALRTQIRQKANSSVAKPDTARAE